MPDASVRTPSRRARVGAVTLLALALLALLGATTDLLPATLRLIGLAEPRDVTVELRSWVVMGRGRHMFAEIILPGGSALRADSAARRDGDSENRTTDGGRDGRPTPMEGWPADLPLIVEYWSTALRDNYAAPADAEKSERIARMQLGHRVKPGLVTPPDNRLEATYQVTLRQAKELARDRVFANRYFLLGPNSSSGLRAAMEQAGLRLPPKVTLSAGPLGEFPGIDLSPGRETPRARWVEFGLPSK